METNIFFSISTHNDNVRPRRAPVIFVPLLDRSDYYSCLGFNSLVAGGELNSGTSADPKVT